MAVEPPLIFDMAIKAFFSAHCNHALAICKYSLVMVNNYGARLAEALRIAQKDRQELADGIGVSVQAIGQVIAGKTKALTAENSALAAKFLGVDMFWLATGMGKPKIVTKPSSQWPFSISVESFLAIPEEEQNRIGEYIEFCVNKWHVAHPPKK